MAPPLAKARRDHFSIVVADIAASVAFYRKTFGYVQLFEAELDRQIEAMTGQPGLSCRLVQMHRGGETERLELIEFRNDTSGGWHRADGVPFAHLAFAMPDIEAALAEIEAAGGVVIGDVVTFEEGRCAYCREPGGSVFELEETGR